MNLRKREARFPAPLTLRISAEMHGRLNEMADREGRSMAEVVREVLARGIALEESAVKKGRAS